MALPNDKELMYDPDQPRELLTSEIDVVSRVDPFRSSTTSLQGVVGEQKPAAVPMSSEELKLQK